MLRSLLIALVFCASTGNQSWGQSGNYHFPLHHRHPPGMAGEWAVTIDRCLANSPQPVRILLPSTGQVTFAARGTTATASAPAQASMFVGHLYRIRISDLPEFPGLELYPTIEILDRLHPPEGLAETYPIPVELTLEEISAALDNRMVTKVIYLEQPDLAAPLAQGRGPRVEDVHPALNLLEAADRKGRPMAILRLGGRRFDLQDFYQANDSTAPIAGPATTVGH